MGPSTWPTSVPYWTWTTRTTPPTPTLTKGARCSRTMPTLAMMGSGCWTTWSRRSSKAWRPPPPRKWMVESARRRLLLLLQDIRGVHRTMIRRRRRRRKTAICSSSHHHPKHRPRPRRGSSRRRSRGSSNGMPSIRYVQPCQIYVYTLISCIYGTCIYFFTVLIPNLALF